ncbi:hypothetical protein [Microbispora sp. ATCC PTA-5024]|uniref:hypothetical protein n=1 Tax=Microbispora sp. ATCC PTA-5024 TaxID=316330 RepID=UPI0003DD190D|nr:hypothetical protein [Microbispora sp. ATCC PTA-5024]ETK36113.1 hypothetical protein MPTA5024_10840 [Microbispora sp. ATCC PTA-5024]
MDRGYIYETQASFTHPTVAPDRTHPLLRPLADDVHPVWGIVCHYPDWRADETNPSNGDHWEIRPHVLLEEFCSRFGFDVDEVPTIVDTILHYKLPDRSDVLAWQNPTTAAALKAAEDIPDPTDVRLPYVERREAMLARAAVVKAHLVQVTPAPREDRQAALDYRRALVEQAAEQWAAAGGELPPQFLLGLDDVAPEDPLELITSHRLDGNRVRARRARDEWELAAGDRAVHPAVAAAGAPMTFGMDRLVPPAIRPGP